MTGLSSTAAADLLARVGPNALPDPAPDPLWRRVLRQFASPLIAILLVALAVDLGRWLWEGGRGWPLDGAAVAGLHPASDASWSLSLHRDGKTWQAGDLCLPNEGDFGNPNETMVTELSDGRVMLVSRSVSKANRKIVTTSPDGARKWSAPVFHPQSLFGL